MNRFFRLCFGLRRTLACGLVLASSLLAGCSSVQTTQPGVVNVQRTQYMSSLVSEAQLEQEAAQQYGTLIATARTKGQLDTDAAQTKRVKQIADRLIRQVGGVSHRCAEMELAGPRAEVRRSQCLVHAGRENRRL